MTTKVKTKRVHTTIGELITAIVDAAKKVTTDERRAYHLTDFVLSQMLRPVPLTVTNRPSRTRKA